MLIEINTSESTDIDWGASGVSEVAQNVYTLINTLKYEVAYDRTLGLQPNFIDMPLTESVALVTAQIYAIVDEREPRATVESVEFIGVSEDGNLMLRVVIDV
ncbi:hypothetical protein EHS13_20255 [Paenibacillus psychroresistens]|uniref:IraD/Gp25-like domain-containing protein n=1 Tax=Paenibacillus psychroresistens TaxID=1778678 RepID=A0A6B8RMX8_9BACL|nr:hypothetical protein [Paenibacillus psychroresistens]QGQ97052.1 hypothetical protein EHS13_20255 [Paenibacillus psychroresistens]